MAAIVVRLGSKPKFPISINGSMLRKDNHSSKHSGLGKYFGTKNTVTLIVLLYKFDIVVISHFISDCLTLLIGLIGNGHKFDFIAIHYLIRL